MRAGAALAVVVVCAVGGAARADTTVSLAPFPAQVALPGEWTATAGDAGPTLTETDAPALVVAVRLEYAHCEALLRGAAARSGTPYVADSRVPPPGYEHEAIEAPDGVQVCAMTAGGALSVRVGGDYAGHAELVADLLARLAAAIAPLIPHLPESAGPRQDGMALPGLGIDVAAQPGYAATYVQRGGAWLDVIASEPPGLELQLELAGALDCAHALQLATAAPGARVVVDPPFLPAGARWLPAVILDEHHAVACLQRAQGKAIVAQLAGDYATAAPDVATLLQHVGEAYGRPVTAIAVPLTPEITATLDPAYLFAWTAAPDADQGSVVFGRFGDPRLAVIAHPRAPGCRAMLADARTQSHGAYTERPAGFSDRLAARVVQTPAGELVGCVDGPQLGLLLTFRGTAGIDHGRALELAALQSALAAAIGATTAIPAAPLGPARVVAEVTPDAAPAVLVLEVGGGIESLHGEPTDQTMGITAGVGRVQALYTHGREIAVQVGGDATLGYAAEGTTYDARGRLAGWYRTANVDGGAFAVAGVDSVSLTAAAVDPWGFDPRPYAGGGVAVRLHAGRAALDASYELDSSRERRFELMVRYFGEIGPNIKAMGLGVRSIAYHGEGTATGLAYWLGF